MAVLHECNSGRIQYHLYLHIAANTQELLFLLPIKFMSLTSSAKTQMTMKHIPGTTVLRAGWRLGVWCWAACGTLQPHHFISFHKNDHLVSSIVVALLMLTT